MTENKRFDFEDEYITLDGGVFATAKTRHDAELISRTLNQLYDEYDHMTTVKIVEDILKYYMNMLPAGHMSFSEFVILENVVLRLNRGLDENRDK